MRETNHPLLVSVKSGELGPCDQGNDCEMWASGLLTITDGKHARTVLTAAGCEVCPNPCLRNDDIGVISASDVKISEPDHMMLATEIRNSDLLLAARMDQIQERQQASSTLPFPV